MKMFALLMLMALSASAQTRASKPDAREGAKCQASNDCALGFYCTEKSVCTIGCVTDVDCADPRVCAEMRACKGRQRCRKVCHLPDLSQP